MKTLNLSVLAILAVALPCSAEDGKKKDKGHEHHAPHGGTLVVLGEESAHVELVLDAKEGTLTGYVLDGEAENAVKIKQEEIVIEVTWPAVKDEKTGKEESKTSKLVLKAVEHSLTGEKKGDTSEFSVKDASLKGVKEFDAVIPVLEIKGMAFEKTAFNFPKGNDHDEEEKKEGGSK